MVCSAHTEPGSLRSHCTYIRQYIGQDWQTQVRDTEHKPSQTLPTLEGLITLLQPMGFAYFIRTKSSPSHYGVKTNPCLVFFCNCATYEDFLNLQNN